MHCCRRPLRWIGNDVRFKVRYWAGGGCDLMTINRRVPLPKSSWDYGTYNWHYAWHVDVVNREVTHRTGIVFQFSGTPHSGPRLARPPLGGWCPCGAWYGELRGGVEELRQRPKEAASMRLCLEALQLFSDMATFACQDCPEDTLGGDYYMVHNELWDRVHPNGAGMLCLSCLEIRAGRRLRLSDFTDAPINCQARIAEFCADAPQLDEDDDLRDALLDQLGDNLGAWTNRLTIWRWRLLIKRHTQLGKNAEA